MIEFIVLSSLFFGLIALMLGLWRNHKWYWAAGLSIYIFSFLASWSIGAYTLSIAFLLWALAIGYSLKLIKKYYHIILAVVGGLAVWFIMINTLDDVWWFFPFSILFRLIS